MTEMFIDFSGWIKADIDTIRFVSVRDDETHGCTISGEEYISLEADARDSFIIESLGDAIRDALDEDYMDLEISVEEEEE